MTNGCAIKLITVCRFFGADTDNPDQRISEDVRLFVEMTLTFSIGVLKAVCTFVSFVFVLYNIPGRLILRFGGHSFHIEWLYGVGGAYLFGAWHLGNACCRQKLVGFNFVQQRYEADFRFSMMRMRENAESIAFYSGEGREGSIF